MVRAGEEKELAQVNGSIINHAYQPPHHLDGLGYCAKSGSSTGNGMNTHREGVRN